MAAQDRNKVCPKCFEVNDPAATYCLECGAPLSDEPGAEGSDQEVYREITQANLHRIRGDYKPAIDVCLGILKRFPNNGTAHTLLGDIYAEKGELEQAAEWFEMALDLRPESENDRRKLEAVQRRRSEQDAASAAQQLGIPESKPRAQQYVFVMVLLVVIVGIGSFLLGGSMAPNRNSGQPKTITDPINVGDPKPDQSVPTGQQPTNNEPVVQATVYPGSPVEQQTAALLAQKYTIGRKILGVHEDPRGPSLHLTAKLEKEDDPASVAIDIARAVFTEYATFASITVELGDGAQTVFVADVVRTDYDKVTNEKLDAKTMLTHVWPATG